MVKLFLVRSYVRFVRCPWPKGNQHRSKCAECKWWRQQPSSIFGIVGILEWKEAGGSALWQRNDAKDSSVMRCSGYFTMAKAVSRFCPTMCRMWTARCGQELRSSLGSRIPCRTCNSTSERQKRQTVVRTVIARKLPEAITTWLAYAL